MSLLTDQEIHAADPAPHERFDQERIDFARAIEQAVIRKLATVGVEPVGEVVEYNDYGFPWKRIQYTYDSEIAELPLGTKVYTAEALSAARVQALDEAAKRIEGPNNNYGAVIRALIGGPT